jgi:hypothetical protein
MTTPTDGTQPLPREAWSVVMRIGTIAVLAADGKSADVAIADGTLTAVPMLASVATTTVGTCVLVLLDRETAIIVGNPK